MFGVGFFFSRADCRDSAGCSHGWRTTTQCEEACPRNKKWMMKICCNQFFLDYFDPWLQGLRTRMACNAATRKIHQGLNALTPPNVTPPNKKRTSEFWLWVPPQNCQKKDCKKRKKCTIWNQTLHFLEKWQLFIEKLQYCNISKTVKLLWAKGGQYHLGDVQRSVKPSVVRTKFSPELWCIFLCVFFLR